MKLYLSSFRVGNRADVLRRLASGRTLGFIPNAMDHVGAAARDASNAQGLAEVRDLDIDIEVLDLRDAFGQPDLLEARCKDLGGVWVRGGNSFVLRQAMRLSGFDRLIHGLAAEDFLYAGYSAGICVLGPTLECLRHVDDPQATAYPESEVIWEGLGILDYVILPHYQSEHPESETIDREVTCCREHGIPFRTLRDGDVIVIDDLRTARSAGSAY